MHRWASWNRPRPLRSAKGLPRGNATPQGRRHGKDQSTSSRRAAEALGKTCFPIGELRKAEGWAKLAHAAVLPVYGQADATAFASAASGPFQEFLSLYLPHNRGPQKTAARVPARPSLLALYTRVTFRSRLGGLAGTPPRPGTGPTRHRRHLAHRRPGSTIPCDVDAFYVEQSTA